MNSKKTYFLFFFGIMISLGSLFGQEISTEGPTDDLGNVSDAFQENFFEALKQKGIENYELALEALQRAQRAAKENKTSKAVVQFEMAKNQRHLKRYQAAEDNLKNVMITQGDRLDVLEELYDLYAEQRSYAKAIVLVQKLIPLDEDYKEDLANLYHRTKQYDKALILLDELDDNRGEDAYRDALRRQIYRVTGNSDGAIKNLETKIDKNPKKEQDYLNLIFLYSEQGEEVKAFETAQELLKNQPKSELAHLALYKFYLDQGNAVEAMNSMNIVFRSNKVEKDAKYKVLSDFLSFANGNPTYESQIESVITTFAKEGNGKVYEQLGGFYASKGDKEQALRFYEKGIVIDSDNFSLLKKTLLLQIENQRYNEAVVLSENGLTTFPAQPLLYLINGVANNRTENTDAAIESLETGIDFLLDDAIMEKDFYEQLSIAYSQKGNSKKASDYQKKADAIQLDN